GLRRSRPAVPVVRARGLLGAVRDGAKRRPDRRFPALCAGERADPTHRAAVDVALNEVVEDELLVAHADIGAIAGAGRTARIRLRLEFLDQSSGRTRLELRQDPSRHEICGDPEAAWESSFTRLDSLL